MDGVYSQRKKNIDGQMSLFGALQEESESNLEIRYPNIKEFNKKYMLAMEKEMTGLYMSGHPLDDYEKPFKEIHYNDRKNNRSSKEFK